MQTATAPTPIGRLMLKMNEVTKRIGVSRRTIERMIHAGKFPPPTRRAGRVMLWHVDKVQAWTEGN